MHERDKDEFKRQFAASYLAARDEGSSTRLEDIRREVDCPRFPHGDSDKRFLLTALDAANAENAILRTCFCIAPDETVVASVPGSILIDNKGGTRRRYFTATDEERKLKEQLDAVTVERDRIPANMRRA